MTRGSGENRSQKKAPAASPPERKANEWQGILK